jgi:glycosyltransferase involved in cell wall biosynthesis
MTGAMEIVLLTKDTGWYGAHSGYYEQLPKHLAETPFKVNVIKPHSGVFRRLIGKIYSRFRRWPQRNQALTYAELVFRRKLRKKSTSSIGHVLNFEEHYLVFHPSIKNACTTIATIHIPPWRWSPLMTTCVTQLAGAIVLYRRDIKYLENYIGEGKVKFIPHGVDTEFFRPGAGFVSIPPEPRLLFVGQFLRNIGMLNRVVRRLQKDHPNLRFDFAVARHAFEGAEFRELLSLTDVVWHHGISDCELLSLYQNAYILLVPMDESGANNAVVEALATGLPVVTTDVGGIRDYGGADIFPIVANNDDDAMVALVERYLQNPAWREVVSQKQRGFAVEEFNWKRTTELHIQAYQEFLL